MKPLIKKIVSPLIPVLFLLMIIQIIFYQEIQDFPPYIVLLTILYSWILGAFAIYFSRKEKLPLPIFTKPNRYWAHAILVTLATGALAFLASIPFGGTEVLNRGYEGRSFGGDIELTAHFILMYYVALTLILVLLFLGGELYWRGFVWEKLKRYGIDAVWTIAFLWSLWMLPLFIFSSPLDLPSVASGIFWIFALNFTLTPLLLYYRTQGKSILVPTLFYSSLFAIPVLVKVLFPVFSTVLSVVYWGISLCLLIGYSQYLKLYSKKTWGR